MKWRCARGYGEGYDIGLEYETAVGAWVWGVVYREGGMRRIE